MTFFETPPEGAYVSTLHVLPNQSVTLYFNIVTPSSAPIGDLPQVSGTPSWNTAGNLTIAVQSGGFSAIVSTPNTWGQENVTASAISGGIVYTQTWTLIEGEMGGYQSL